MTSLSDIPELRCWRRGNGLVRIPPGVDVPLTERVRRLIDTAAFRRLAQISQLGLVSLVYPAANHTRQEHSLGVFFAAIEYLDRLTADERFAATVTPADAELFLVAALLHDVGHYPFGHPIEDLHLIGVPEHEQLARRLIVGDEIGTLLREDWSLNPTDVADVVANETDGAARRILSSMLSGPIDVDKIDYLMRDSLHAGVPYGRHFDRRRLVGSLCLNEAGDGLAISDKGRTAAEMMVFARYVMFSEVYWHHAVRAATAMLQRAFYLLRDSLDLDRLVTLTDRPMIEELIACCQVTPTDVTGRLGETSRRGAANELLDGLFGPRRRLYKRLAQYSFFEEPAMYERLARRPFPELVRYAEQIATGLSGALGEPIAPHEVLIDAPPMELEVDFDIEVFFPKQRVFRRLGDVSPVVRTLAREQFDDFVKRVRIFVHPRTADRLRRLSNLGEQIIRAIE